MTKKSVEIAPCVLLVENALDNCEEIIDKATQKKMIDNAIDAKILSDTGWDNVLQQDVRNTKIINIAPLYSNDKFWWETAQKIWENGNEYAIEYDIAFSNMENPQFLWYKSGEGFYKPHIDTHHTLNRLFSCVLYLNDVDDGGETYFEYFNLSVKPKAGSMILFPSNFAYLHGAKVPISNDKLAIVTWFTT